jgi:hypothetical protein
MYVIRAEVRNLLGPQLFEAVPLNVSVIDREFRIVAANQNLTNLFGEWPGKRCYEVCTGEANCAADCVAVVHDLLCVKEGRSTSRLRLHAGHGAISAPTRTSQSFNWSR